MEIRVSLVGRTLEELVKTLGQIMDYEPIASNSPEGTYAIGDVEVASDGTVTFQEHMGAESTLLVLLALIESDFLEELPDGLQEAMETPALPQATDDTGKLVIRVPLTGFSDIALDNLMRLIGSKEALLKKAIEADSLPVENNDTTLAFPWFKQDASSDEVAAYTHLVNALCDMAKRQTRVLAVERPVENEKYTFRCFLLRLGMIGEEYATTRRILLKNFSGNGSMKVSVREKPTGQPSQPTPTVMPDKPRFSWRRLFRRCRQGES